MRTFTRLIIRSQKEWAPMALQWRSPNVGSYRYVITKVNKKIVKEERKAYIQHFLSLMSAYLCLI